MSNLTRMESIENKTDLDRELDFLELKIKELKVSYEQHFSGYIPQPPSKEHEELRRYIRKIMNAPFKSTAASFRLNTLVRRFKTYASQWERISKERERGTYYKDVFKANLREKAIQREKRAVSKAGKAEQAMKQLFNSYQSAMMASGKSVDKLDFNKFKQSLAKRSSEIKKQSGSKKLKYQIVSVDGQIKVKTTAIKK